MAVPKNQPFQRHGGFAGGKERHRTPSGRLPPPRRGGGGVTPGISRAQEEALRVSEAKRKVAEAQKRATELEAEKQAKIKAAQQIAATKKAETIKRFREAQRLLDQRNRERRLRERLSQQGAQRLEQTLRDQRTGAQIKFETLINRRTGERIFKKTNLRTGVTSTRTFETPKRGGRARETGGIGERIETEKLKEVRREEERKERIKESIQNFKDMLQEKINLSKAEQARIQEDPINIFSIKTWRDFGKALNKSKSQQDRNLGKKILTQPLLYASKFILRTAEAKDIPLGLWLLAKNPSNIKEVPGNIKADIGDTINLLKTSASEGVGKIGADLFTFKVIGGSLKFTGQVTRSANVKFNPYFKRFKNNVIEYNIPSETLIQRGRNTFLPQKFSVKRSLIDRIRGKKVSVKLKKGLLKETARPLSEQIKLAGTKGTIVTAQADRLLTFFRRNRLIRKPIPNETTFSHLTKQLLKRFDEGKISQRDFLKLNQRVLNESGKTLLERSLFADPTGLIRFTRLGGEVAEASLKDLLRGNFSLRRAKPQIIIFPEGQIAKFPKSLKNIIRKLKANKKLTPQERAQLVKWQTKPSPKWKPLGDIEYKGGIELEVTLSPGQTIRRIKKLRPVVIDGVPVQVITAQIIKLSKKTSQLLNKAKQGIIKPLEINDLRKLLSKETKLRIRTKEIKNLNKFIRRKPGVKPRFPLVRKGITAAAKVARKRPPKRKPGRVTPRPPRVPKRPTPRPPRKITPRPTRVAPRIKRPSKRPPKAPPKRPPRRPPKRPPKAPPKKILITPLKKGFSKRTLKKAQQGYFIKIKRHGKIVNLHPKPLLIDDAKDFLAYRLDHGLSRSAWFEPLGKTKEVVALPKPIKGYFRKISHKLRPFKVKVGVKKKIRMGYIEKKKFIGDVPEEIRELQRERARAKKRKPVKKRGAKKKSIKRITKRSPKKKSVKRRPTSSRRIRR